MTIFFFTKTNFLLSSLLLCLVSTNAFTQSISYDNHTGSWDETQTWQGGSIPTKNITNENIIINGYVTLTGNLNFNGTGIISINDTLVVTGDISCANPGGSGTTTNISLGAAGVLIVLGDLSSKNKIEIDNGGRIVIGGSLTSNGSKATYSGSPGSAIYAINGGGGFNLSNCINGSTSNCLGIASQLFQTPIGQFFSTLTSTYSISVNSTCFTNSGTPVSLSYSPSPAAGTINKINWYKDGNSVCSNCLTTFTSWSAGTYASSYTLISDNKTYWAKSIAVLGATSAISGNTSVLAGSTNTYSIAAVTNASSYTWVVPAGSTILSGQGSQSIVLKAGTQVGVLTVTPVNGPSQGCMSSLMINIKDPTCDCSGSAYWSKNNYTGLWSDPNSWGNSNNGTTPLPPPTDPNNSQTLCISGTITLNGNLKLATSNQYICDTLIITGDLLADNPTLTVGPKGVLIVLGNYVGKSGGINNQGRIIIAGTYTEPYQIVSGSGKTYIFDPAPSIPTWETKPVDNKNTLQTNDPILYNYFLSISCGVGVNGGTIGNANQTICFGSPAASLTNITIASPGVFNYQWYSSNTTNNPATAGWSTIPGAINSSYSPGVVSQSTYYYRKATKGSGCIANSNVASVLVYPNPNVGPLNSKDELNGR
jgi:hypothetical protein